MRGNAKGSSRKACTLTTTLVIISPFLLPPKRGKKKRRMNSKISDQKSCLSARSAKVRKKDRKSQRNFKKGKEKIDS